MTILYAVLVLGALGAIFGLILALAAKVFHVEVDPKQAAVRECLAGANCGGCGYPGCDGYAAAVAKGEAPGNKCVVVDPEVHDQIAQIMGVVNDAAEKKLAFVACSTTPARETAAPRCSSAAKATSSAPLPASAWATV